jgi:hypothetical protein
VCTIAELFFSFDDFSRPIFSFFARKIRSFLFFVLFPGKEERKKVELIYRILSLSLGFDIVAQFST